jgi:DNA-binding HxlR family transcriptional regulator
MKLEKITEIDATVRRSYDDACAAAHALDLLGERWALLVMRELMLGPRRFGDLRAELPGISANVLTQRLEGLERMGIVARRKLPPPSGAQVYEMTPWGLESEPIFQTLGRWAARSPFHDPTLAFSAASMCLSFRTMFDPSRARGLAIEAGFRVRGEEYHASIREGRLVAGRAPAQPAAFIMTGEARVIAAVVYGGAPLDGLESDGALVLEGDRIKAERFVTLFPLPPKAGA